MEWKPSWREKPPVAKCGPFSFLQASLQPFVLSPFALLNRPWPSLRAPALRFWPSDDLLALPVHSNFQGPNVSEGTYKRQFWKTSSRKLRERIKGNGTLRALGETVEYIDEKPGEWTRRKFDLFFHLRGPFLSHSVPSSFVRKRKRDRESVVVPLPYLWSFLFLCLDLPDIWMPVCLTIFRGDRRRVNNGKKIENIHSSVKVGNCHEW